MKDLQEVEIKMPKRGLSTRTTFSIDKGSIERIDKLSEKYKISAKEIIDLSLKFSDYIIDNPQALYPVDKSKLIKKVYALNEDMRDRLNKFSNDNDISRDVFFMSIVHLLDVYLEQEEKKEIEGLKEVVNILNKLHKEIELVDKNIKKHLDEDSPVLQRFDVVEIHLNDLIIAIEEKLEKGIPIDPWG